MLQRLEARLDRVQAPMLAAALAFDPSAWFSQAEHAAMSQAVKAYCAGQEPPATALQTLCMTASDFDNMMARIDAAC